MATGFQIAFLILAFQFFAMLAATWAASRIHWPPGAIELLGQVIAFAAAASLLAGVGALRRFCREELGRGLPPGALGELALVSATKVAVPLAAVGAAVLWAYTCGTPEKMASTHNHVDPARAWEWTLSPLGLLRMVILSWIVGPIIEELVFRGLLFRAWERQWGWKRSLLLTSAMFGLFHPGSMASSFLGSIVYICVLRRTGTLRASILVHSAYNVLVSWPLLGQVIMAPPAGDPVRLATWVLPLACLSLVAVALPAYLWAARADARTAGSGCRSMHAEAVA